MGNAWCKTSGNSARYLSLDTAARTATDLAAVNLTDYTSVAGLAYFVPKGYLVGVKRDGSTVVPNPKVYLYDASASQTAPTLLATASYST